MELNQRTVVLTGAASGIGQALAQRLDQAGCHLALIDRDEGGLRQTRAQLRGDDRRLSLHTADLSDRQRIRLLSDEILGIHPGIDMLVNNAGVALGGQFEEVSEEDFDWLMRINFDAVVTMTRTFLPALRRSVGPARIVNVSSLYGLISPPGQAAYSASKFAVRGFSNALRHELRGSNVGVTVVHPGGVATSIATNARTPELADADRVRLERRRMEKLLRMPPARAAEIIVNAIARDRERVLVGTDAIITSLIERLMPVGYWSLIERLMVSSSR